MNTELDVNVLISVYTQKISVLSNQNVLLEAKLQSVIKELEELKNKYEERESK